MLGVRLCLVCVLEGRCERLRALIDSPRNWLWVCVPEGRGERRQALEDYSLLRQFCSVYVP